MALPQGTVGRGSRVAAVHVAFLALSFAGWDVQDPWPCPHGLAGTRNPLGPLMLPVWLMLPAGQGRAAWPWQHTEPWHGAGPGWSLAGR